MGGQFTLLWNYSDKLPSNSIVTVFWCSKSRDSNCANGVEWKELSKDATKFEIPAEEGFINYAFTSISVNNITRGMKIVPCRLSVALDDKSVKLKLLKSSSKSLKFSLETNICSTFSANELIFQKVTLNYCELANEGCQNELSVVFNSSEIRITNLKRMTCYSFNYAIETSFDSVIVSKSTETFCTAPVSPPVIISAGHLTNQTIVIRTLPVNIDRPISVSCIFIIGSQTFNTVCEDITVVPHQLNNGQECLRVAAAFSTMGGQSRWSRYSKIKRTPKAPAIKSVKKTHDLLTGSDKIVEIKFTSGEAKYCEIKVVDKRARTDLSARPKLPGGIPRD